MLRSLNLKQIQILSNCHQLPALLRTNINSSRSNLLRITSILDPSSYNSQFKNMSSAADKGDVTKHYDLNDRFKPVGDKNVWVEFTQMARDYNAINMGQGFPDYESCKYMNEKVQETMKDTNHLVHQYTRSPGNVRLVTALAKSYGMLFKREIDPLTEVLITVGAYGSLFNALAGLLSKGDECIIIEPFFDCYAPMVVQAGATCRFVPLRLNEKAAAASSCSSADWCWDDAELEKAFTDKTKLIILNTPNNPIGKVFSQKELERVAELCIKHNVICISDEVYEHLTYEKPHIRMATLPGMWERTLTIGCAGKAFSCTGIKMGWTIGPKELIRPCQVVHNNSVYCCPTFFQEVIARCFEHEIERQDSPECYFNSIKEECKPKRDALAKLLIGAGLKPVIPEGGYFMLAEISNLKESKDFETDPSEWKDSKFVKYLIKEKGLATIPSTSFYSVGNKKIGENYIRFCFFKNDTTLEKAAEILKNL